MPVNIVVPPFGESIFEATVGQWLKREGDAVAAGEPVVELETEKVNTQVSAPEAGILAGILHREGDVVHPGDVLASIAESQPAERQAQAAPAQTQAPPETAERRQVSPVAQRLAEELAVDLSQVKGTGPGGRITKDDVLSFAQTEPAPPLEEAPRATEAAPPFPAPPLPPVPPVVPTAGRPETRQPMSRRRLTIARRLVEAQQTAAMLTTFNEIDMQAIIDLRKRRREAFRAATGADLGYMSFFVKAAVGALKAFPNVNSELVGDELVLKHYYDIGIAIGDPEGLVVPVLRDADRLTFAQIELRIADFIQMTTSRTLSIEDLRGGTFTITNGGVFGSLFSTPILNPPQVGILGMHKIADRPAVLAGQIVVRPMMIVALTYDHRVVDGRDAVLFLVRIKELVEDPERLLLEG